ncbi:hypothetical protein CAI21_09395 [Alkalilimnicola ehrlichii]|nr:AraC family transcriptional regulator [Alkalilimnicola ehrlichii]RFA29288.1 hypothetical protein CAI21_09395 [Alkalilimnicola ehrlichii]
MSKIDYLASGFIEPLKTYVQELDLPAAELLGEMRQELESPNVSAQRFCQLLESVWQLDPVDALGVRLGLSVQPRHFGVLGYMVSSCGTLGQALARYHRYHALLQGGLVSRAWLRDGVLYMRWTQAVANTPLASEFSLAGFVSLCQTLIGRPVTPLRAGLPFPRPRDGSVYQVLLGCPVDFDRSAIELAIPAHLLALSISSKDPYLLRLLEQQAQALLEQAPRLEGGHMGAFFSRVQEQIVESMKNGDVSAESVAQALGCPCAPSTANCVLRATAIAACSRIPVTPWPDNTWLIQPWRKRMWRCCSAIPSKARLSGRFAAGPARPRGPTVPAWRAKVRMHRVGITGSS